MTRDERRTDEYLKNIIIYVKQRDVNGQENAVCVRERERVCESEQMARSRRAQLEPPEGGAERDEHDERAADGAHTNATLWYGCTVR